MPNSNFASCWVIPTTLLVASYHQKCLQKSVYKVLPSNLSGTNAEMNRVAKGDTQIDVVDESNLATEPTTVPEQRKRPRLDVSEITGGRDRKRGKSMFGILVGTLNKAKIEDKQRNASEAVSATSLHTCDTHEENS